MPLQYSKEFIGLQVKFAQRIAAISTRTFGDVLSKDTLVRDMCDFKLKNLQRSEPLTLM